MLAPIRPRPIMPSCIAPVSLLCCGRALREPWFLPIVVTTHERLRGLGTPGAGVVKVDLAGLVQQRLHDPPGLFDVVHPGEKLAIAGQPRVEEALVGPYRLTEVDCKRRIQVNV